LAQAPATHGEQGLDLLGTPEEPALLDEVVRLAYEEKRLPGRPNTDRAAREEAVSATGLPGTSARLPPWLLDHVRRCALLLIRPRRL